MACGESGTDSSVATDVLSVSDSVRQDIYSGSQVDEVELTIESSAGIASGTASGETADGTLSSGVTVPFSSSSLTSNDTLIAPWPESSSQAATGAGTESLQVPFPNNGIPYMRITMADTNTMDSSVYSTCTIEIAGNGIYADLPASNAQIRLRGNSTRLWYDKKPYRIKFAQKTSVLGLDTNKDWVLLANYRDQSKFMNAVAFDMARYMGSFAFVNANRFVEVEINGDYKGFYQLTEQIERAKSRVNIGTGGVLFGLDKDDGPELSPTETNNFYSKVYGMPVAVKYPKDVTEAQRESIAEDFSVLEQAIADADYDSVQKLLDVASFIDFVLLQELTRNVELEAPRSMYIYKDDGGVYHFGPVWDFDGGFGYSWDEETKEYFGSQSWLLGSANPSTSPYNCVATSKNEWGMCDVADGSMENSRNIFIQSNYDGYAVPGFFVNLFSCEKFLSAYKARYAELQGGLLEGVFEKLDGYVTSAEKALRNDAERWPPVRGFADEVENLKLWLTERVEKYGSVVQGY